MEMTRDELEEIMRPLSKQILELANGKRMHLLILGFTLDEENAPGHISAYGTFGHHRNNLIGCAQMLFSLANPEIGVYADPPKEH